MYIFFSHEELNSERVKLIVTLLRSTDWSVFCKVVEWHTKRTVLWMREMNLRRPSHKSRVLASAITRFKSVYL